ncbi:hypothetical protein PHISCL_09918 [Aspergillus sclerotialis]|uniref:Calcium uniporter protein n=1 Tax=Aspergillus sclerotialis TaxID=2070753 RepID=A0A3A2Z8Y9_9EURO|nr:hypothetical protein PHISCL_09918 [Aspergillus sclerotialis]
MEDKKEAPSEKSGEVTARGKLLTTPSRLFKLIVPLATVDRRVRHRDIEPIAMLIHPHQPLSQLERLIQSELPPVEDDNGQCRPPAVSFIALQHEGIAIRPKHSIYKGTAEVLQVEGGEGPVTQRTRKVGEEEADNYVQSRKRGEDGKEQRFVRWAQSTEIGDFIQDAARAREFIMIIEGGGSNVHQIKVTVPSFSERTYFLRMRLRKLSRRIHGIAEVKLECDALAQRGAQRVAIGGFGVLAFWWLLVYNITFETDLGWDTMEPVTYLVSLSTLMGGYLWFLYHNREISYRSALDFTISARQKKLYQMKGVDLALWTTLIDEGNALRKEIKNIAAEYDVEWDERADEEDERVTEALKQERLQKNGNGQRHRDEDKEDHD